jgi:hypothetical protein
MDSATFADYLISRWKDYDEPEEKLAEYITARDAELWRMAQERMRSRSASQIAGHVGMHRCTDGVTRLAGTQECLSGMQDAIYSLPLDPLPGGDTIEGTKVNNV